MPSPAQTEAVQPNPVQYARQGRIGVNTVDYPPLNAVGHGVRCGLVAELDDWLADAEAEALLLV